MIWGIGVDIGLIGFFVGRTWGRMEVAEFVWNLLVNNRNEDMAGAVCLYLLKYLPNKMKANGLRNLDDAYNAITSKRKLVDY